MSLSPTTFRRPAVALALGLGVLASPLVAGSAGAQPVPPPPPAQIVGHLGYEGGAYPGGFHRTSGTVEVIFDGDTPLALVKKVGPSGKFDFKLGAGKYTLIGCGPSSSQGSTGTCGKPVTVSLVNGEVDHIRLVWAEVP